MRPFGVLRGAAVLAAAVVAAAAWTVYGTIRQAIDSNQLVLHTQEVLSQIETVRGTLVAAESDAASPRPGSPSNVPNAVERAQRDIGNQLDRLAALIADNPAQQRRVVELRERASRTLATPAPLPEAVRANMDDVRRIAQDMRLEENQLLQDRARTDQAAVRRLAVVAVVVLAASTTLLVFVFWSVRRDVRKRESGSEALSSAKAQLEQQVSASADALRDSNTRLQSIIDSAVDAIIVIDASGRVEAFNRGAERLFGYPADEVIGRNVSMLMPSPDHEQHDRYLDSYMKTGLPKIIGVGREVIGRRRDGTAVPVHLSVGEMTIGGARKFTGVLHDLTARVELDARLRASEARWRSIIQSAVDGIVVIDAHGRIEAFNEAAERLFGYSEAEVLGRNVNMLMPSPYHEEHDLYLTRYQATGVKKIIGSGREVTGLRKDGTTFPLHLAVGELMVGGERKFTGILHDLSARVQMEAQLREQASLVRLGEMAAVLAHEIKNPLAGIRGAIQVIGGRLPAQSRDAAVVKDVVARIDGLGELMKDLLLFARPPQPKPQPVELRELVSGTAQLLNSDPALKELDVHVDGSAPVIEADPELLKIVFLNLLANGAQAMQGRGTIQVSLGVVGQSCQIVFTDQGPGIPDEVRERIFTPFFTTKSRGTGLGLPTAKRLIDAHRGDITIACPPGGGTAVTVRLPASGAQAI